MAAPACQAAPPARIALRRGERCRRRPCRRPRRRRRAAAAATVAARPSRRSGWLSRRRRVVVLPRGRARRPCPRSRSRSRRARGSGAARAVPRAATAIRRPPPHPRRGAAGETALQRRRPRRHRPGPRDVASGSGAGGVQKASGVIVPGGVLDEVQETHEQRTGDPGAETERDDEHPEAGAVAGDDPAPGDVWLMRGPMLGIRVRPVRSGRCALGRWLHG